jgi:hypothetical protein
MYRFFELVTIGNEVYYSIEFSLEDVQQLCAIAFPLYTSLAGSLMLRSLLSLLSVLSLSAPVLEPRMCCLRTNTFDLQRRKT